MQTLILPGYSASNKEWVDDVVKNLKVEGTIRPFYWMHWTDENSKFDAKQKAGLIAKHIRGDKVNIIAKSLGTLIVGYLWQIIPTQIEKVVFCGIPVKDITSEELEIVKRCISQMNDKIIVLQNVNDPHGTFEEVKDFGNIRMTSRDDHTYPFFDKFNEFLN